LTLEKIQQANTEQNRWTLNDFLQSNLMLERKEYKAIVANLNRFELPLSVTINILWGPNQTVRWKDAFEKGEFKVYNEKEAQRVFESISKIRQSVYFYREKAFIAAFEKCIEIPKFRIERFIRKLGFTPINKCGRWTDYIPEIQRVYNYKEKQEQFLYFQLEIDKILTESRRLKYRNSRK
jgi:hypothetical protein